MGAGAGYPEPIWLGREGMCPEAWMSQFKKEIWNFPARYGISPTTSKVSHLINASVIPSRPGFMDSADVSCPFQKIKQIFLSGMLSGENQLELFEVRVEGCFKAGVEKHSVKNQRLNISGFVGCMICSTLLLSCSFK